jgi:hypothetical protein
VNWTRRKLSVSSAASSAAVVPLRFPSTNGWARRTLAQTSGAIGEELAEDLAVPGAQQRGGELERTGVRERTERLEDVRQPVDADVPSLLRGQSGRTEERRFLMIPESPERSAMRRAHAPPLEGRQRRLGIVDVGLVSHNSFHRQQPPVTDGRRRTVAPPCDGTLDRPGRPSADPATHFGAPQNQDLGIASRNRRQAKQTRGNQPLSSVAVSPTTSVVDPRTTTPNGRQAKQTSG